MYCGEEHTQTHQHGPQVVVLMPQELSWWRPPRRRILCEFKKFNMSCNAFLILNHINNLCNFKIKD